MDEDKRAKQIELGIRAAALLGDPVFTEAFDEVRKDLVQSLLNATNGQDAHHGVMRVQMLDEVKQKLSTFVINGRYAAN